MKNKHIPHLEDFLLEQYFHYRVKTDQITVKYDGSPSIFIGADSEDGKFFVAKKSIFNEEPIVYKSITEIWNSELENGLKHKLSECFDYLYSEQLEGIYQGDLLFTSKDKFFFDHDSKSYLAFHPNTIVYAIPTDSDEAKKISKSELGVVWHTTYRGQTIKTMSRVIDAPVLKIDSEFVYTPEVNIKSSIDETFSSLIEESLYENFKPLIQKYFNYQLKVSDPVSLYSFIELYLKTERDNRITSKGKAKYTELLYSLSQDIVQVEYMYQQIQSAKEELISNLNKHSTLECFLLDIFGHYWKTNHEGYVISINETLIKLVNRSGFSSANFNSEFRKGFERAIR